MRIAWPKLTRSRREQFTGTLFTVGFGLALWFFCENSKQEGLARLSNAVHESLQLVALEGGNHAAADWKLHVARVLLPLATAQVVLLMLVARTEQLWLRFRMRLSVLTFEVAVLGCGSTGLRIAQWYRRDNGPWLGFTKRRFLWQKRSVIGVDRDLSTPNAVEFKQHFKMIEGALESNETLQELHLERRALIVICTGNDAHDIELARRIVKLLPAVAEVEKAAVTPRIIVSVESASVARAAMFDSDLRDWYDSGRLDFLSATHAAARLMLLRHPPHLLHAGRFRVERPNPCHIAVYATGTMLEELIAQAVRALVYDFDPLHSLRVTALTPHAAAARKHFFGRFPALAPSALASQDPAYGDRLPLAQITFIEAGPEQLPIHALRRADALQRIDAIYTAGQHSTEHNLLAAEAIKASHLLASKPPVVAMVRNHVQVPRNPLKEDWRVTVRFVEIEPWLPPEGIPDPSADGQGPEAFVDEIAKRLWWHYENSSAAKPVPEYNAEKADSGWAATPHAVKWENRYAADHNLLKLKLLGVPNGDRAAVRAALDTHIKWLIELEHRRFVCERMTDGWLRIENGKIKDVHLNWTLSSFKPLPTDERDKDLRIVNLIADLLSAFAEVDARIMQAASDEV